MSDRRHSDIEPESFPPTPIPGGIAAKEVRMSDKDKPFKCHILLTEDLGAIPSSITTVENWGPLTVIINNNPKDQAHGEHVFLRGAIEDFEAWWKGKSVWMGVGHPQFQQFETEKYA